MRTTITTLLALAAPNAALACGGFFCNQNAPVDQTGETIVFSVDHEADTVEMHVQVEYEGPADEFAWVLPVKGEPDVFLSHSALFDALPMELPTWFRIDGDDSRCSLFTSSSAAVADSAGGSGGTNDIVVLSEQLVGAYEVAILAADDSAALVDWLQANDYDIPDALEDVLVPYVAHDMNFMALKLRKGTPDGDLSPLGLRYSGKVPAIPIELTSLAASPDMPLIVYLFGDARAVPLNYLHVQINPVAIDYWRGGANYDEVIGMAADEAGGQAFATDLVAETTALDGAVFHPDQFELSRVVYDTVAARFVESLPGAGFGFTDEVMTVLRRHAPMPSGFENGETEFYGCPSCYEEDWAGIRIDPDAALAELEELEIAPRITAQEMIDARRMVTRLRSSMSPAEMTVDPTFGFNPDLPLPPDISTMKDTLLCDAVVTSPWDALQRLEYPLGFGLTIPSSNKLAEMGLTEFEYVQRVAPPAALLVEELGESGQGTVVIDNRPEQTAGLRDIDQGPSTLTDGEQAGGCGCSTSGPGAALGLVLPLLALVRRRR